MPPAAPNRYPPKTTSSGQRRGDAAAAGRNATTDAAARTQQGPKIVCWASRRRAAGTLAPMLNCAYRSGGGLRACYEQIAAESDGQVRAALQSGLLSDETSWTSCKSDWKGGRGGRRVVIGRVSPDGGQARLLLEDIEAGRRRRPIGPTIWPRLSRRWGLGDGRGHHPRFAPPPMTCAPARLRTDTRRRSSKARETRPGMQRGAGYF